MYDLIIKAREFAVKAHNDVNHWYGDVPYTTHLQAVVTVADKHLELLHSVERPVAISACWCHDTIADTRKTYKDVKRATSEEVAEIVRLVTEDVRGRDREERMPLSAYIEIGHNKLALFVKLCDRIANVSNSLVTGHKMYITYLDEREKVVKGFTSYSAWSDQFAPMFKELADLQSEESQKQYYATRKKLYQGDV